MRIKWWIFALSFLFVLSLTVLDLNTASEVQSSERVVIDSHDVETNICVETLTPPAQLAIGSTVMLLGDSHAAGMEPEFRSIVKDAGYAPAVHSIVGSNTKTWLSLIQEDLDKFNPSLVIVSLGTNDAAGNLSWIDSNADMYQKLVESVRNAGSKVVWVTPPKAFSKRVPYVEEVTHYIQNTQVDSYVTYLTSVPMSKDGIHSTVMGYKQLVDDLWAWMASQDIVYAVCTCR